MNMDLINMRLKEISDLDRQLEEDNNFFERVLLLTLRDIAVKKMIQEIREMDQ